VSGDLVGESCEGVIGADGDRASELLDARVGDEVVVLDAPADRTVAETVVAECVGKHRGVDDERFRIDEALGGTCRCGGAE
jgi:hypothetical protein